MAHSVQKVVERCEHAQGGEDGEGEGKGQLGKPHRHPNPEVGRKESWPLYLKRQPSHAVSLKYIPS